MSVSPSDWQQAVLPVLDEAGCAAWCEALGHRVVEHRSRLWLESTPFFFQPVHHLARLRLDQVGRPVPWCLGFRARLAEEDAARANGSLPAHMLPDPQSYDLARLAPTPRRQVRQGLRASDIVALASPDLVLDQGYALVREAHAREPGIPLPRPEAFRRLVRSYLEPGRGLILAALDGRRLLGFSLVYAVEQVAYHDMVYVGREGLTRKVPVTLLHAFATLVARRPELTEVMHGLHCREDAGLCEFKRRVGLPVVPVPTRAWLAPVLGGLVRLARPHKHYRLTGRA